MKVCGRCGEEKPDVEFSWKAVGVKRTSYCKVCNKAYQKRYYLENSEAARKRSKKRNERIRKEMKEMVSQAKTSCVICGESHPATLVFHHRDPLMKAFTISTAARFRSGVTVAALREELAKCDVLCANCHRRLHANQLLSG